MADLDPDAAALLERLRASGAPPLQEGTPEQARAGHESSAAALSGPGEPVEDVHDLTVDGVPVRVFVPRDARGTTVYAHGGGWVVGTLDTYDPLCRALANRSGSTVVSVGYDLAPESRHPVQVRQVLAVLRWASARGGRVAAAGDSAGAHLVALATGLALREGLAVAALALVYPVVAPALDTPSARELATGRYLETAAMRWYWQHYLPEGDSEVPVDASAQDLTGFPPTLVLTAGFDPLRDEGLGMADALEAAGVEVERLSFDEQIHGFVRMTALIGAAAEAHRALGAFLVRSLA